jgi:signal transduction histidine kinase
MLTRRHAYWLCQIAGWGSLNAIKVLVIGLQGEITLARLANPVVHAALGIGLTHAFRAYVKRQEWMRLPLRALLPRVVGGTLVLSGLIFVLFFAVCQYTPVDPLVPDDRSAWSVRYLVTAFLNAIIFLLLWSTLYFGLHSFWRYRQAEIERWKLEAQAEAARLEALKLQLNPHFFFNSLNSVRALIAQDPDRAQTMVTRLARLLRRTLMASDEKTVPLQKELSTTRTYLELEKVRLEDRLHYEIATDDGLADAIVPHLLVQTLAENAIKHGIAPRAGGGRLTIAATREADTLQIRVTNPGSLDTTDGGVGLKNTRERLQLLFGETAALTLQETDGTVTATARMPACTDSLPSPDRPTAPSRPPTNDLSPTEQAASA